MQRLYCCFSTFYTSPPPPQLRTLDYLVYLSIHTEHTHSPCKYMKYTAWLGSAVCVPVPTDISTLLSSPALVGFVLLLLLLHTANFLYCSL